MFKIKNVFVRFLCLAIIFSLTSVKADAVSVSAQSAVLMCADTGEVLFSQNAEKRLSMASTTKIMTALLLIEQNTPEKVVSVTKEMTAVEGTSMGLLPGDSVTYRALVCGMLLSSGNDAALTSAIAVSGSEKEFSRLMNEKASEIGMKNTNFVTASGLDSEEHYSTAYDMALLGCEAIRDVRFRSICSQKHITLEYGNPPYRRTLSNHNRLLDKYSFTIGIKTGFTKKSGRCLVSAAEKDGITLVAVTLNAPDDWNDHIGMFEYGFSVLSKVPLDNVLNTSLAVVGGQKSDAKLVLLQEPSVIIKSDGNAFDIEREVFIKPFEYAPIQKGDVVGKAVYKKGEETVFVSDIVTAEDIPIKEPVLSEPKLEHKGFLKETADKIKEFINKWHSR